MCHLLYPVEPVVSWRDDRGTAVGATFLALLEVSLLPLSERTMTCMPELKRWITEHAHWGTGMQKPMLREEQPNRPDRTHDVKSGILPFNVISG